MRVAAYARYSSDHQRESSLEDQLRNCRAYCTRQGWPAPEPFTDAEISGARTDRPGYQRLLAVAAQFDVIIVDDMSRLSRDSIEVARVVRRLRFAGVRMIGVSDGVDTSRKSHKLDVALRGLMGELYLDDLADKTHRGLAGRALAGASAGGLPYGYVVTETGQRAIHPRQANIVRRIYRDYLAGASPRAIASALNRDHVPPPRGRTWSMSVIHGDRRRGIGILCNPIYGGKQVWNRSQWLKHPVTGRRVRRERPESEWITTEHPELAIIDAATLAAVQARLAARAVKHSKKGGPGRPPRHLLSGLLRCGTCGGPMIMVSGHAYGCSRHKDRGDAACSNKHRVPARAAEQALLAGIRQQLSSEESFQAFQRRAAAALKRTAPALAALQHQQAEAERERDNLLAALRAGIITPSTRAALLQAEAAVSQAVAALDAAHQAAPAKLLPDARRRWKDIVANLADVTRNVPAARETLRNLLGEIRVTRDENGAVWAETTPQALKVVAGAGFEPATFGL